MKICIVLLLFASALCARAQNYTCNNISKAYRDASCCAVPDGDTELAKGNIGGCSDAEFGIIQTYMHNYTNWEHYRHCYSNEGPACVPGRFFGWPEGHINHHQPFHLPLTAVSSNCRAFIERFARIFAYL